VVVLIKELKALKASSRSSPIYLRIYMIKPMRFLDLKSICYIRRKWGMYALSQIAEPAN